MGAGTEMSSLLLSPSGIVGGIVLLLTYLILKYRRPAGYPPGPPIMPIFGSIFFMPRIEPDYGLEALQWMAKKYGPVFSFGVGNRNTVVLSDYQSISEACLKKGTDFADRPDFYKMAQAVPTYKTHKGIIKGNYSDNWKLERHTALSVLKELGYGQSITERRIKEEIEYLTDICRKQVNQSFDICAVIHNAVANIICALLFGERFEYDSQEFQELRQTIDQLFTGVMEQNAAESIPLFRYFPGYSAYISKLTDCYKHLYRFMSRKVKEHGDLSGIDSPRDFIEGYMKMSKQTGEDRQKWLAVHMDDFFKAGMETTTTTLGWGVYYMIKYPYIQDRVQEELDRVVGPNKLVSLSDRTNLPYTDATLHELFRMSSTVPMALPHQTLRDTSVAGYNIPKGTQVIMGLWNVHNDPDLWPEPKVFRPERFLGADGKVIKKDQLIPFGMGRRTCLGEQLARQELFLFFTNLIKTFRMALPEGSHLPVQRGWWAVTHQPPKFNVCLEVRG